jgi:hypothetical protein
MTGKTAHKGCIAVMTGMGAAGIRVYAIFKSLYSGFDEYRFAEYLPAYNFL